MPTIAFTDTPTWSEYRLHLVMERGLRPNTIRTYRSNLNRWARFLEPKGWQEATVRDLERFLRRPVGRGQGRQGQALSVNVRRHYTVSVVGLYRWGHRTGQLHRDPMASVSIGRAPTPIPKDLSLGEIRSLLLVVTGDERTTVAIWLGYGLGLRIGEIARLNIEDIQLRGPRPHAWILHSKGGRSRLVPLPAPVRQVLGGYLAQRPSVGPVLQREHPADGSPMRPGSVGDLIGDAMRAAGLDGGAHRLRHSYATQLLSASKGRDLYAVSKLLGHATTALTETTYALAYKGELDATAGRLPDPRGDHATAR